MLEQTIDFIKNNIILFGCIIAVIAILFVVVVALILRSKRKAHQYFENDIFDDVKKDNIIEDIEVIKKDINIVLQKGIVYKVKADTQFTSGQYIVNASDKNITTFNIKIAGYVRKCEKDMVVTLNELDEVGAVSCSLVLKKISN